MQSFQKPADSERIVLIVRRTHGEDSEAGRQQESTQPENSTRRMATSGDLLSVLTILFLLSEVLRSCS